ncbi:Syntaxin-like protein psy1 [Colletotrichum sidae]|uniref:Syntaxin-like protein psy1 n=4 Tax=Colletotrichum orbiculare species complex TaxID=2707354 RepID=N4VI47_COLOR|nr:Syntaxin-like protein psy1 [Colletotrichum orbiculare MAFF 240422]TDZ32502.1 Syntaxin-like protein psy1 [Colletotrichum spinosum]TDZ53931.1 Syntaxin-like protein psy1 [Colletotrichum trifolii]TEA14891.1 Syntaxin-like protein psy1 [Colletotrichum sidae]
MSYGQYNNNPYAQGPNAEGGGDGGYGYANQPQQSYGQNYGQGQYEMQPYGQEPNQYANQPAAPTTMTQQDFLSRVQYLRGEIQALTTDVENVGYLHQRSLSSPDASASQQLEQAVTETQLRNTRVKDGIKALERDLSKTQDGSFKTKSAQLSTLKNTFKSELDKYQQIERDYQKRYREQIARQYRIVNPEATEEEVKEATEADWGDEGVFQTALKSNRTGQANSVLGNVRARHNELQRIEKTLIELAQLYQEMATLVEAQEPVVNAAEQNAEQTVENIHKGNEQVEVANKHARNRRKLKWWCLLITIIIIALAVGLGVGLYEANKNK